MRALFWRLIVPLVLLGCLLIGYQSFRRGRRAPLVVYCAHDSIYSEKILRRFEERTGIPLAIRFDTEATKSLGLVELLLREKSAGQCDVFWNNEVLGTLRLCEAGLLLPYQGPGYQRIPAEFKDPAGQWTGFAARLRVYILNTEKLSVSEEAVARALASDDLSHTTLAKPLYGTTLTHYTVLWQRWGRERLIAWHRDWRRRGVNEVAGNAMVKDLVAQGTCSLGLSDTDDYFEAKDQGMPVAMLPFRLEDGSTICIPNTVCILKSSTRPDAAKRLTDFLLSAEVEEALARTKSRQIPLGPTAEEGLPEEVRQLKKLSAQHVDLGHLENAARDCLQWLKSEDGGKE